MTRDDAYAFLNQMVKSENLIKHHLACEAAMIGIYNWIQKPKNQPINQEEQAKWSMVGLLHDADYEESKEHPEKHTLILEEKLKDQVPQDVIYAIKAHNHKYTKVSPKSLMDWAIVCCDELTGLIIAAALIHPDKKLSSIDLNFVMNRYKEKSFAKGADRKSIENCKKHLEIKLEDFISIVLTSMQQIAPSLGL
ncbi:MAG: hypothetical protein A3B38_01250 [Candidatus Levybacteria bacterium RIFCSPLOWO2_01_FULL_36_13]|nr:MAG: hypothetical protein A2684_02490 [Candidatus Levybacteria bacterium RIFCSPHIGHO2_01_FULL_36_15b]OGH35512.1 MAG: hypothetical protein A3B38_01250 [Candidatus Levybacteria bacterium RIFCSPLOWO2_01_FULL_36_13]